MGGDPKTNTSFKNVPGKSEIGSLKETTISNFVLMRMFTYNQCRCCSLGFCSIIDSDNISFKKLTRFSTDLKMVATCWHNRDGEFMEATEQHAKMTKAEERYGR